MTRPRPLLAGAALWIGMAPALAAGPQVTPRVGSYGIAIRTSFDSIPINITSLECWFPMPLETAVQRIGKRLITSPSYLETKYLPDDKGVALHMKLGPRGGLGFLVEIRYEVERTEVLAPDWDAAAKPGGEEEKTAHERWLRPESLVVIDKEVEAAALRIAEGRRKPLDRARAVYDHLVGKVLPVKPGELSGTGYGDAKLTVTRMKGDDNDITAAFVSLCRALGIPARSITGLRMPEGWKEGDFQGFDTWAEFYLDGIGWVSADPAAGRRNPARRLYYFGALDERRVAISIGRDVTLEPAQAGPPLNYWIRPYWEGNQKPMHDPSMNMSFVEIDPNAPAQAPPALPPS